MTNKYGGGQERNLHDVAFGEFVQFIRGIDIPFKGLTYTWSNKIKGSYLIQEHLDKVISCLECQIVYPRVGLAHLVTTQLNHCLILLNTMANKDNNLRPFHFFLTWFRNQKYK